MKTHNEQAMANSRLAFIETLSAEFMAHSGVGVYVYLDPMAINSLFRHYLMHTETIHLFVKHYVRHYFIEHDLL